MSTELEQYQQLQEINKIACKYELNCQENSCFEKNLEESLKELEKIDFISFASAFEIERQQTVKRSFNGLFDSIEFDANNNLHQVFRKLTESSPSQLGLEEDWYWRELREDIISDAHGIFTPTIVILDSNEDTVNEFFRIFCFKNLPDNNELNKLNTDNLLEYIKNKWEKDEFYNGQDKENHKALFYSVYSVLLSDIIKKTPREKALIIIWGTRKEFTKRDLDYGLMVGLIDSGLAIINEVAYAIINYWSVIAVSPYILEDGKKLQRITKLESNRSVIHTLKGLINIDTIPPLEDIIFQDKIKTLLTEQQKIIINLSLKKLIAFPCLISFINRRPLDNGYQDERDALRAEDVEEYNFLEEIEELFKEKLGDDNVTTNRQNENSIEDIQSEKSWISSYYLAYEMLEVIQNIQRHGKTPVTINFTIENQENESILKIEVINEPKKPPSTDNNDSNSKIHGLQSLNAFFEALKGKAEHTYSNSKKDNTGIYYHHTIMSYNLTQWNEAVTKQLKSSDNS